MFLMNKQDMMEKDEIIEFVKSCHHDNGGFGASEYHDPHLLYTLSAIQVSCIFHFKYQAIVVKWLWLIIIISEQPHIGLVIIHAIQANNNSVISIISRTSK